MKFTELGLGEEVMQGIDAMNYVEMTPVQEHTMPVIMTGRDVIGCAQTGTGKTAAYLLPLMDKLAREGNPDDQVKALIIVPTRELAQQIDVQIQGFSYFLPVSAAVVHGSGDGTDWSRQKQGIVMGADIVVATPGRLLAFIDIASGIDFSHVEYFVLDEADRMLDMGFWDDIMKIIGQLPTEQRQTLLFSATLPPKIREMSKQILRDPAEVTIAVSKPNEAIEQTAYVVYDAQKNQLVKELFGKPTGSKTIMFSSSKLRVKELAFTLKRMGINAAAMHSDLEQSKREEVMLDFKNGKIDLLVATDIVARGIDIEDIGVVVNYDVPRDAEDYIHRIGRTARASAEGKAITFVGEKDQGKFHAIERFLGREIPKIALPEGLATLAYAPSEDGGRGHGRTGSGRGRGAGSGDSSQRKGHSRGRGRSRGERSSTQTAETQHHSTPEVAAQGEQKPKPRHRGGRNRRRGPKPGTAE